MKMGCQYSRVARLSSRKLKKVRKESTLETNKKIPARNPELEILLGGGKAVIRSGFIKPKAQSGLETVDGGNEGERRGVLKRPFLTAEEGGGGAVFLQWRKIPTGIQPWRPHQHKEDHLKTTGIETRPLTSAENLSGRLVCKERWKKWGNGLGMK